MNDNIINPRLGLTRCLSKFIEGGNHTVAFLGGSITEMNGYSRLIEEKLTAMFPACRFNFINAGLSSTCSDTGAFRFGTDVLEKTNGSPLALLFVEFAVNDNQDGHLPPERSKRAMEGIVLQAKANNPNVDIVFLLCINKSHLENYDKGIVPQEIAAHETVAEQYGIPSVNFAKDVQERISRGDFDWAKFGGEHPAPFGAAIYLEDVERLLNYELKRLKNEALDSLCLRHARFVSPQKAVVNGDWHFHVPVWSNFPGLVRKQFANVPILYSNVPGASFTFTFQGTAIGAFVLSGPDSGIVDFRIDERPWASMDLLHNYSKNLHYPRTVMFADDLTDDKHTFELKITNSKNDESTGFFARIVYLAINSANDTLS